jgi:hypothetical protein
LVPPGFKLSLAVAEPGGTGRIWGEQGGQVDARKPQAIGPVPRLAAMEKGPGFSHGGWAGTARAPMSTFANRRGA